LAKQMLPSDCLISHGRTLWLGQEILMFTTERERAKTPDTTEVQLIPSIEESNNGYHRESSFYRSMFHQPVIPCEEGSILRGSWQDMCMDGNISWQ
jgi:hypothetical protein